MKHLSSPSRQIGDFLVTALSDGNMAASLDLLSGIETADAGVIQHSAGIAEPGNIHINCHTPGHTGFRIDSGDNCLLIWGDIVHFPHIQSAHPTVSIAFDCDPAQAEDTRKKLLEQVVMEKLLVAGMHLGRQGFAHVHTADGGYRFEFTGD